MKTKKVFSLEASNEVVKGIVISLVGDNYFLQVVEQTGTTLVKKNKDKTSVVAEGSITEVFKHLPKNTIDYQNQFSVCVENNELFVYPITIGANNKKYTLGARVETPTEVKIVNLTIYEEYVWLAEHITKKPTTSALPRPWRKTNSARVSQINM